MPVRLADAFVAIGVDDRGLDRELDRSRGKIDRWGNVVQGIFQGVGQAVFHAVSTGIGAAIREIDKSITAASDLSENVNRVGVVFGESADEILAWSKTTDRAIGQSSNQALKAAGDFGNLFTSLGLSRDAAGNMSVELVELASDLASFNNIDPTEALEKLRAGLVGETEPLRAVGVFLNEAVVQAKALELGLASTTKEITEQDKVLARFAVIMDQTANAQGDFARTSDDLANAQRRLDAQLANVSTTLGSAFLPIKTTVINGLSDLITAVEPYGENIINSIAAGMADGIRAITPVLVAFRDLITFWLRPGSPPRLLPDLDKWGMGAAEAYLKGWTQADFGAIETLGNSIERVLRSFVSSGALGETDLFGAVTGSRNALASAVNEFSNSGSVSDATFARIRESAGAAGGAIEQLARRYFDLQNATEASRRAQEDLQRVQDRYSEALAPLSDELRGVQDRRQEIQDAQRLAELRATINNPFASGQDKELAQLEAREIDIRQRQRDLEAERDAALETAQAKVDAAAQEQQAAQVQFNLAQANLDQQLKYNDLVAEEIALQNRLAEARRRAAESAAASAEREREAAIRKIQQAIMDNIREQERLSDAQLRYQLQVADTPGKLAIMRDELAKVAVGSVEYYEILTQIAQLESQLASERSKGGGAAGGAFPTLPAIEAPDLTGFTEAGEGIKSLKDALDGLFGTITTGQVTFDEQTDLMMEHTFDFSKDSSGELSDWQAEIISIFRILKATLTGDNEAIWKEIESTTRRYAEQEQAGLEGAWNRTLLRFIENRGDLKRTASETWEAMYTAYVKWRDKSDEAIKTWARNIGTFLSEWSADRIWDFTTWGAGLVNGMRSGFEGAWNNFKTWAGSLAMPWANWQLPSWLQRHSPSELEQTLMGVTDSLKQIRNVGLQTPALVAPVGDTFNILFNQEFAPNADVGMARQATRQGIGDSVLEKRRRRGR